jgi:1,4-dihydroxy-2-naphthoate octaprenyltransferase
VAQRSSRPPARNTPAKKGPSPKPSGKGGHPAGPAAKKQVRGPSRAKKATAREWIAGARLRTLPLAIAPVALGTAAAYVAKGYNLLLALLCLAVALLLQIAVNFANDYSDGVRGTDANRVGPARLTGSGAARPRTVLTVALVFFGLAAGAGVAVVVLSAAWWLLVVGAAAIAAAYFYTGGPKPYGYAGFGEIVAFLFFGVVATAGTMFVQVDTVSIEGWLAGVSAGLFAAAVLLVNNIRDREPDAAAAKRTLAVRIGDLPARILFAVLLLTPFGILVFFALFYPLAYLVWFALLAALPAVLITLTARTPAELILALRLTTLTALLFGLGLAAALAF